MELEETIQKQKEAAALVNDARQKWLAKYPDHIEQLAVNSCSCLSDFLQMQGRLDCHQVLKGQGLLHEWQIGTLVISTAAAAAAAAAGGGGGGAWVC